MAIKKDKMSFKIKVDYSKLPNLFHQEQVMKGAKIHKDKSKVIPRKKKYKNKEMSEDV